jgi:conjugal transfer pilus assembly protein TraF
MSKVSTMLWVLALTAAPTLGWADATAETKSSVSYWQRLQEGWFWYEDPPKPREEERSPVAPAAGTPIPPKPRELAEHETLVKRLEDLRNIAFMNPTEGNVKAYLDMQTHVVEKASMFADVWQRVVWANPYMDFTVRGRPVNAQALEVYDRQKERATSDLLASLSRTHVLFFFFRSDCPYCHQFAPLLRNFEREFGLTIFPISVDGGGLPDFPNPNRDNGIVTNLGVNTVPALFLASPSKGEIIPLGAGLMSETELLERIRIATKPVETQPTSSAPTTASVR